MPTADPITSSLLPSLIDRLTIPGSLGPSPLGTSLSFMIESVRTDVEALLNTRKNDDPELAEYPELAKSVFAFGMPELVSRPALTTSDRISIGRAMAETISRYEPRMTEVRVTLITPPNATLERKLRFRIEGVIRVEPAPDVEFETVLELSTGQALVSTGVS